jgi:hypothetical protein
VAHHWWNVFAQYGMAALNNPCVVWSQETKHTKQPNVASLNFFTEIKRKAQTASRGTICIAPRTYAGRSSIIRGSILQRQRPADQQIE